MAKTCLCGCRQLRVASRPAVLAADAEYVRKVVTQGAGELFSTRSMVTRSWIWRDSSVLFLKRRRGSAGMRSGEADLRALGEVTILVGAEHAAREAALLFVMSSAKCWTADPNSNFAAGWSLKSQQLLVMLDIIGGPNETKL